MNPTTLKQIYKHAKKIVELLDTADQRAGSADGPVSETWANMSTEERDKFLKACYRLGQIVSQL